MPSVLFWLGALVCLGLGAGFFMVAARSWLSRLTQALDPAARERRLRPRKLLWLGLTWVVLGSLMIARWHVARFNERTEAERASALMIDILKTDKIARLSHLQGGFERGPKDVQPT